MSTLLRDFRGQVSWGRVCALVALVVAVWREFTGADIRHVALWLGVATGSYGTSKLTEIVALLKGVGSVPPTPLPEMESAPRGASLGSDGGNQ